MNSLTMFATTLFTLVTAFLFVSGAKTPGMNNSEFEYTDDQIFEVDVRTLSNQTSKLEVDYPHSHFTVLTDDSENEGLRHETVKVQNYKLEKGRLSIRYRVSSKSKRLDEWNAFASSIYNPLQKFPDVKIEVIALINDFLLITMVSFEYSIAAFPSEKRISPFLNFVQREHAVAISKSRFGWLISLFKSFFGIYPKKSITYEHSQLPWSINL